MRKKAKIGVHQRLRMQTVHCVTTTDAHTLTCGAQVCFLFPHAFQTTEKQKQIVTVMQHTTLFSFFVHSHINISVLVQDTRYYRARHTHRYEFMMDIKRAADVVVIIIIIFIHIAAVAATIAIVVALGRVIHGIGVRKVSVHS